MTATRPTGWLQRLLAPLAATENISRSVWDQHRAAWRALAPAWPAALGAVAAAIMFTVPAQGTEALLATIDIGGGGAARDSEAYNGTLTRYWLFLAALAIYCMGLAASALYATAIERGSGESGDSPQRIPPDPIHASISLRSNASLALGVLPIAAIVLYLIVPFDASAGGMAVALRWLAAIGVGFAVFGFCSLLEFILWKRQGDVRQINLEMMEDRRTRRDESKPWSYRLRRGWIVARYSFYTALRWFIRAPHAYGTGVIAFLAVLAMSRDEILDAQWGRTTPTHPQPFPVGISELEWGILGVIAVAAVVGYVFQGLRYRSMKALDLQSGKHLIVDQQFQKWYRAFSTVVAIALLVFLWSPIDGRNTHAAAGPGVVFLAGMTVVISYIGWLVRMAVESPPDLHMPPTRNPFEWFLRGVDVFKRWGPSLLFAFGVAELLTEKIFLPLADTFGSGGQRTDFIAVTGGTMVLLVALAWLFLADGKIRKRPVRLASGVVLLPFLLGTLGDNHEVTTLRRDPGDRIVTIDDRATNWLLDHRGPEGSTNRIPALVIMAEGGGVRAMSHAAQMLSALDLEAATGHAHQPDFHNDIYLITGVSGGAVGVATYLATRAEMNRRAGQDGLTPEQEVKRLQERVQATVSRDYLSPLIGGMFASDAITTILPVNIFNRLCRLRYPDRPDPCGFEQRNPRGFWDRADFFERSLTLNWKELPKSDAETKLAKGEPEWLDRPMEEVVEKARLGNVPPVVLFGAFAADDGGMAAASNVSFASACRAAARGEATLINLQSCLGDTRTLPLSTAAHLSARFPGSNPPGVVPAPVVNSEGVVVDWGSRRVVDGGYIDNPGATATAFAVQRLYTAADRMDEEGNARAVQTGGAACTPSTCIRDRLQIVVLYFHKRGFGVDTHKRGEPVMSEVSTPISAIMNARETSGRMPLARLCRLVAADPRHAEEACDRLLAKTVWVPKPEWIAAREAAAPDQRDSVKPCDASAVRTTFGAGSQNDRSGLVWLNANLDVPVDPHDSEFILLGWMAKQKSHTMIQAQANCVAGLVLDALEEIRSSPR
jgi:hypothetical protein